MTRLAASLRIVIPAGLLLAAASSALANWTATGVFKYQDRDWNNTGFTGTTTDKPVRFADVQIVDANKNGGGAIIANGKTDANGAYSIAVTDSSTRTVYARVLTSTTQTSDLFVKVTTQGNNGSVYAAATSTVVNHAPTVNVNFGTLTAQAFAGGEAFNIFDLGVYGADFIKSLTGSRPNSSKLVTFKWATNGGVTVSTTSGNTVSLRDTAGYDDPPILHEWGHYIMTSNYSRATNPGGTHMLSNCAEDLGLSFDEGRASEFGAQVRRYNGMPFANWYIKTDGASGPGHIVNEYNLETATEYPCTGDTSEVSVSRSLWDIGDGPATTDDTPGVDDNPPDALALPDLETWQVFNGPIKNGTGNVNLERFWDGWFDPTVANGFKPEMTSIFSANVIEFFQDAYEPNNTTATATLIAPNTGLIHNTYFYDPDGDGKGQADTDDFKFSAVSGSVYTIETLNLLSDANTKLELIGTDGSTVLVTNDDRAAGDPSSLITWTATQTGTFYIRSTHAPDLGIYGSYDLRLQGPPGPCGTTDCPHTVCNDIDGNQDTCHPGVGGCSGNIDTGLTTCVDAGVTRSCPGNQHVHLQTCSCTCLGNACGTHVTYDDCE